MALGVDELIGPYRIVRMIGEGGMGVVWEAIHERLEKSVAIKTLHPTMAVQGEAVARFMREGQAASRIRHRHIVDVTDVGVSEGIPYLVMELLAGEPLSTLLERGAVPVSEAIGIALPTIDALYAAHLAGVIHRDLKPENIFLRESPTSDPDPVIVDFGISKIETGNARLTKTSAVMGTPFYMSPEQARGAKMLDARSDQFALGLVIYEMIAGRRAIQGDSLLEVVFKVSSGDYPPLASLDTPAPPGLAAVVDQMIALDPTRRFASLRDAGRAIVRFADPTTRAVWSRQFGEATVPVEVAAPVAPAPDARTSSTSHPGVPTPMASEAFALPPATSTSTLALVGGIGAAVLVGLAGVLWFVHMQGASTEVTASPLPMAEVAEVATTTTTTTLALRIAATPDTSQISLDGVVLGVGSLTRDVPRDGSQHVLLVEAPGYVSQRIEFSDAAPAERIALERAPHEPPPAPHDGARTPHGVDAPVATSVAHGEATSPQHRLATTVHSGDDAADRTRSGANGSVIIR